MNSDWYFAKQGDTFGPFSAEQIIELLNSRALEPGALVWRQGLDRWRPAGEVFRTAPSPRSPLLPPLPSESGSGNSPTPERGSVAARIRPRQAAAIATGCLHVLFVLILINSADNPIILLFGPLALAAVVGECILHKRPTPGSRLALGGAGGTALLSLMLLHALRPTMIYDAGSWFKVDYALPMGWLLLFAVVQMILLAPYKSHADSRAHPTASPIANPET